NRRLVDRANQTTIRGSEAHDVTQASLGAEQLGERLLHLAAELKELSLGLSLGIGTTQSIKVQLVDASPSAPRTFQTLLASSKMAVSEVQFPIGLFHISHQVANTTLEVGERQVGPQPSDHHAIEAVWRVRRVLIERVSTRDASVLRA